MDEDKFKKFVSELKLELNKLLKLINDNEDRIEILESEVARLRK